MRLIWDLPAEAENVRLCRRLVCLTLQHLKIDERDIDEMELALGELCTNVIRHAGMKPGSCYQVELDLDDGKALIIVRDRGIGFEPVIAETPTPTEAGGMGLWLVGQLTDRLTFESTEGEGTTIRAERKLNKVGV